MKKIKYISIFLVITLLTGCGKESSIVNKELLTSDDMYWIDSIALNEENRVTNFYASIGGGTFADSPPELFSHHAYQFNKNGTCSRISIAGKKYLNDDTYISLYPSSLDPEYPWANDLASINGLWIADKEKCTYTIDDDKITITVTSCPHNMVDKEVDISEGTYSIDGKKLKVTWKNQSVDYIYDDSGNPIDIKYEDVYNDVEYTKSKIINDVKKITYARAIKPYMFYDTKIVEYDFDEHLKNNTFFGNMLVDLWAENVLKEYNSNMSIDDLLFANGSSFGFSKGKYIKDSFFYGSLNGTRDIHIPYRKYSDDEIIKNIANHYGADSANVKIYACYNANEYNERYCTDVNDTLNKETKNLMDALQYRDSHYYSAGFYKVELDEKTIKIQLDNPTIWETESFEHVALEDECLYKKR